MTIIPATNDPILARLIQALDRLNPFNIASNAFIAEYDHVINDYLHRNPEDRIIVSALDNILGEKIESVEEAIFNAREQRYWLVFNIAGNATTIDYERSKIQTLSQMKDKMIPEVYDRLAALEPRRFIFEHALREFLTFVKDYSEILNEGEKYQFKLNSNYLGKDNNVLAIEKEHRRLWESQHGINHALNGYITLFEKEYRESLKLQR